MLRSGFFRDVAIVAGGSALAQALTMAFAPIITRLYGADAFGVQGVFMATLAVFVPLSNLTYNVAIVLAPSDNEARALFKLSILIGLAVALVSAAVVGVFHEAIAEAIGFNAGSMLLFLVPIVLFLSASVQPLQQWLIRQKQFRAISRTTVLEAGILGSSKAAAGFVLATAPVLVVLSSLGSIVSALLLWISARPTLLSRSSAADETSETGEVAKPVSLRQVAKKYGDFPLYRAPQVWLNSLSHNVPLLMLAALIGPAAAGFYAIARAVLGLPSSLISRAVGTVFLPRIVEANSRSESLRRLIFSSTAGLAVAGLIPFGVVVAAGPWLFSFVFGAEWVVAGEYARWLALWLYFMFMNVPSVQAIPLLGLQGHLLVYEIVFITLRMGALAFGIVVVQSDLVAIGLFSMFGVVANICLIGWVLIRCDAGGRDGIAPETT